MTLNGRGEEILNNVFQIRNNSRSTRKYSREDTEHSSALETKSRGTEISATHMKGHGTPSPHRLWDGSKQRVTQYVKSISALSGGILKRKITETLYTSVRMLRTQNSYFARFTQLRNNGAVACWCEEFGQMPNETERTSERFVAKENVQLLKNVKRKKEILLVQNPRSDGHRLASTHTCMKEATR